ncbi:hypothetical protein AGMMS49546_29540 [Spirochaetia bacterium]|nr:hypothetical protein AGMMS49546_29540 [Spirochaetia bacterium]
MDGIQTIRLELRSPLFYSADPGLIPFQYEICAGELLFCFDLEPAQSRNIEPESALLLGPLVFAGRLGGKPAEDGQPAPVELPAGRYLFAQERKALNRDEFIEMAVEVQKDGLWERLSPADRLYARYLFEDGRVVTQVFRPY